VTQIKEAMDERYAKNAAYQITHLWDEVRTSELDRHVIQLISPTHNERILEIGCGTGGTATYLCDCKEFFGVDLSEVAILKASQTFGNRSNFKFLLDTHNLGFKNEVFDICIAKEVIEHLSTLQRAIKEAFKI
jgi:SAM-dependent methyltransferase